MNTEVDPGKALEVQGSDGEAWAPEGEEGASLSPQRLRELETALAAAQRDLQSLDSLKADLVSTISHELRTPLVSVRGYADMLSSERLGPLSEPQKQAVEVMLRNIDRLMQIIENILTYSALENGQVPLQLQTVNLKTALASVVRSQQYIAEAREVALQLELPDEAFSIQGDPHHLATLFHQLVSNAVKFNVAGGRVVVRAHPEGNGAAIEVRDTGIGIPPERLDKIFERFYQVDGSRTRRYSGIGLGLAIAHRIVMLHGGTIRAESAKESGSAFVVWLPASPLVTADPGGGASSR